MHSATSLEGSRLVRTVGMCVQTRVAIETHSQTRDAKCCVERPAEEATKPRGKQEPRWTAFFFCHTCQ